MNDDAPTCTLAALHLHPVTSCAGLAPAQALVIETGLDLDRAWMVVDEAGVMVTQRDLPRMALPGPTPADRPGADFGASSADQYAQVCANWPRGAVPPEFYRIGPAPSATLVLSGGLDPVTPPRHGARVAESLGAKARHVVVPNAGHGTLGWTHGAGSGKALAELISGRRPAMPGFGFMA